MSKKIPRKTASTRSHATSVTLKAVFAILIVTAVVFFPSLQNGFTNWDDNQYVTQNQMITELSWSSIATFFTTFYGGNYHPLVALTNAIEYHFWQLNATPYHVINLLLHLGNTALVFYFILLLTRRLEAAVIVALFFGIHPMHVESVAWIAERKDVLYTFFFLGSLIAYLLYIQRGEKAKYLLLSLVLLLISLFSKSAAVITPVVLLLIDFYVKREWNWKLLREKIPFGVLALTFGIIALFSQGSAKALNTLEPFSLLDRFFISSYAIVFYIGKLFWPFNLSAFYNFPLLGIPLPMKYYLAPAILAVLGFIIYKSGNFRRDMLFGFAFYLMSIILVIQIISVGMTVVSERYAYVSYIGLFFILARAYCEIVDGRWRLPAAAKPMLKVSVAALAILCGVLTWERCKVWDNGYSLFTDAIAKEQTSPIPFYNRAMALYHMGEYKPAIADFDRAIAIYNKDVDYFLNRGASKFALGDYIGAKSDFAEILKLNPNNADGLVNIANAEAMLNEYEPAIKHFDRALELNPTGMLAYFNRGHLHFRMNHLAQACADWQRALELGYQDASYMLNKHCTKP
ncbi:MAG: tetratricopeptide repeat protein [Ignavibacteriae bacterium]|nr:tetratricopeptide repeat protein [Ignavibacteriota bacterium]